MNSETVERRNGTPASRKARVNRLVNGAGAGSGVGSALAAIIYFALVEGAKIAVPEYVLIALGVLCGSASSTGAICFDDLRAIVRSRLLNRRAR